MEWKWGTDLRTQRHVFRKRGGTAAGIFCPLYPPVLWSPLLPYAWLWRKLPAPTTGIRLWSDCVSIARFPHTHTHTHTPWAPYTKFVSITGSVYWSSRVNKLNIVCLNQPSRCFPSGCQFSLTSPSCMCHDWYSPLSLKLWTRNVGTQLPALYDSRKG